MDAQNLFGAVQTRKLGWTLIQKYSMHFAYHLPVRNGVVGSYVVVLLHGYPRIWGGKNSKFSTANFLSTENLSPWKLMGTQLHIPSKLQLQFHDLFRGKAHLPGLKFCRRICRELFSVEASGLCDGATLDVSHWDGTGRHSEWPVYGLALWPILQLHAAFAPGHRMASRITLRCFWRCF